MRKKVTNAGFFSDIDPKKRVMYQEFVMPPFSVLDARSGEWIKRKNLWLTLGLRGELGRMPSEDDKYNVAYRRTLDKFGGQLRREYDKKNAVSKLKGNIDDGKFNELDRYDGYENTTGVSVFDPVLCELMYRWFCPSGGMVLDPFAGGATRGIVATTLGFDYTGVEIRADQVEENEKQASNLELHPVWLVGDSYKIDDVLQNGFSCDFLFTCPPYYDREIYSSEKEDGSTHETYEEFIEWYMSILRKACVYLKYNRFLAIVVGEIRDQKVGDYRRFVPDTINIICDYLGYSYYNELILITRTGSLPLRAGRQFKAGRKIGKTHQNVLIFYKGDIKEIRNVFNGSEND